MLSTIRFSANSIDHDGLGNAIISVINTTQNDMTHFVDLTGKKIGDIRFIKRVTTSEKRKVFWLCRCERVKSDGTICGKEFVVPSGDVKSGKTRSCGCLRKDLNSERLNNALDLKGRRFGKLVAIKPTEKRIRGSIVWVCKCDCGNECEMAASSLIISRRKVQSCGCSLVLKRRTPLEKTLLSRWRGIKKRCFDPSCKQYKNYGARGITLYEPWKNDQELFLDYCKSIGAKKWLQIDRINNDGNYEPGNIRFVTKKVNLNNKRNSVKVRFKGKLLTLTQLSRRTGIIRGTLNIWNEKKIIDQKLKDFVHGKVRLKRKENK